VPCKQARIDCRQRFALFLENGPQTLAQFGDIGLTADVVLIAFLALHPSCNRSRLRCDRYNVPRIDLIHGAFTQFAQQRGNFIGCVPVAFIEHQQHRPARRNEGPQRP
jgi:hypothetical protein